MWLCSMALYRKTSMPSNADSGSCHSRTAMLSWTLVVCLAVAASAESTEADGLACNETIVQQLKEIGQRIGSFLPDPWLLSSQSSGSRKGKGSLLGWGLVSGLSWSKAEPPLDSCGSQLLIKVPLQGLARLALPFASTPLYFQGAAAVTANVRITLIEWC
ncbi:uncharacterized protein LOC142767868 [Rhipicephalus microplus]|uniref:uncharacterized protein LOC142767868 n=1 Tax=Rhipicephalus microplus TaxID=6941 RepID=UPI003F6AF8FD